VEDRICLVYSAHELSPRAFEVLKTIKDESGYADIKFQPVVEGMRYADTKILVFGSQKPDIYGVGVEYIHTYSIPQMMSKANALTVVSSALDLHFGEPSPMPSDFHAVRLVVTTIDELVSSGHLDYSLPTAIDIETSGNLGVTHTPEDVEVLTIALHQQNGTDLRTYVYSGNENDEYGGTDPMGQALLAELARDLPKFEKGIYHNGKFDTRVLNRVLSEASGTSVKLNIWFDTMLAHHVLNHAAGLHGLKPLCQMYFGAEEWEADLSKYTKGGGHYELIPNRLLINYNGADVYWTYRLWEFLAPQIEMDENNQTAFELEMQASKMLLDMEMVGIPFHKDEAWKLKARKEAEAGTALMNLRERSSKPGFNPNSPKQVKEHLLEMGVTVSSTDAKTLEALRADVDDDSMVAYFIDDLMICRKANKIIGTYVDGWAKHERGGRVRPTFLVHGTSTGRLSSSAPNAQNVPRDKDIRKIVTLYEGNSLG